MSRSRGHEAGTRSSSVDVLATLDHEPATVAFAAEIVTSGESDQGLLASTYGSDKGICHGGATQSPKYVDDVEDCNDDNT